MNWQQISSNITKYCINVFELQFVISLLSLPILILWGIPTSIMSPIANFIFTPLLILFLWCSCLVTTCIICHIPSLYAESLLHKITTWWLYLLSFSKPQWLLAFPQSTLWLSLMICLVIAILYTYVKPKSITALIVLTCLWLSMIIIRPYYCKIQGIKQINQLPLWVTQINNKTYLIDNGALCNKKNCYKNLDYTILPELIKSTGHATIDTVLFCKPSNKITQVAQQCAAQLNSSTILVTQKNHSYQKLHDAFLQTPIKILPLDHKTRRKTTKNI